MIKQDNLMDNLKFLDIRKLIDNLQDQSMHFKKSLGQNLLVDNNVIKKIIRELKVEENKRVFLEIGPGCGALTYALAPLAERMVVIEIDGNMVEILKKHMKEFPNVEIYHQDALKSNYDEIMGEDYSLVSNLPYNITSPLIMKMLTESKFLKKAVVMVQYEVARRMSSKVGTKEYNQFRVKLEYLCDLTFGFKVHRNSFLPRPRVDSAVLSMIPREIPPVITSDRDILFSTIKTLFSQRRKKISNLIPQIPELEISKEELEAFFSVLEGIEPGRRAESLNLEQFNKISERVMNWNETHNNL